MRKVYPLQRDLSLSMRRMMFIVALSVSALLPANVFALQFTSNLSPGARGTQVKVVQQFLVNSKYLAPPVTGYYGDTTKRAVQAFQRKNGLSVTGIWNQATRQKAEALVSPAPTPAVASTSSNVATTTTSVSATTKNVILKIITQGGTVLYSDNTVACNSFETCQKSFPVNTKVSLRAAPITGYTVTGWSEASCGMSAECVVPLLNDTTVDVRFGVAAIVDAPLGKVVYPTPTESCYVGLGQEKCDLPVYWQNNTALNVTFKINGTEYGLSLESETDPSAKYPVNPDSKLPSEPKDANGPVYFALSPETYTLELKSNSRLLDKVKTEIKCAPGLYYQYGRTCWKDGAKKLYIFRRDGILIKSDPQGIACGYKNEQCNAAFPKDTKVTLTATALPGFYFGGWTGECSGASSTCTIIMQKDSMVGVKQ